MYIHVAQSSSTVYCVALPCSVWVTQVSYHSHLTYIHGYKCSSACKKTMPCSHWPDNAAISSYWCDFLYLEWTKRVDWQKTFCEFHTLWKHYCNKLHNFFHLQLRKYKLWIHFHNLYFLSWHILSPWTTFADFISSPCAFHVHITDLFVVSFNNSVCVIFTIPKPVV